MEINKHMSQDTFIPATHQLFGLRGPYNLPEPQFPNL